MLVADINWLSNRLKTMGPAEVISRLGDVGRHLTMCVSHKAVRGRARKFLQEGCNLFNIPGIAGQLALVPEHVKIGIFATANQWLDHRASFFALRDSPLGNPINWHRDYSSGLVAPLRYSGFVNHRDVVVAGDIKYIWELNRLQHIVLLALAYYWSGDDAYRLEIEKQTISWLQQNPFMKGPNWKSPLEAGMRLISWALVSFLFAQSNQVDVIIRTGLHEMIYQHQYFIRKFHSKHSSANNHLIGEMASLFVSSVFWPWFKESASWRKYSRQKLIEEIDRQVEADGVDKERSTEYQASVVEFFLLAGALGRFIGDPFPQEYWDRVARMIAFLTAISSRAGDLPMFGDGDSAQVVWLPETLVERLNSLTGIFHFREYPVCSDLRLVLLLWGQTPGDLPIPSVPLSTQNLQIFPDGGYYVVATDRGGDDELLIVLDAGPLGLSPLNAHGHADALSIWLSYGGCEFLIDPGTFCYYTDPDWRSYFRGTAAHNTVRVDGLDQSVAHGPFLWHQAAHCQLERLDDQGEFLCAEGFHDGYQRLSDPVIHKRGLRLAKKSRTLIITDRLECCGTHEVELFFHFAEKCQIKKSGSRSFEVSNCHKRLSIQLDRRLNPVIYRGSERPIFGWVSRTFGVKEPSFTLIGRVTVTGSTEFHTQILAV
jgi:Heparinase II/III-like protein/Heparinase II/III N-terminus